MSEHEEYVTDSQLAALHRLAVGQPDEWWHSSTVADLVEELIRRRGTDRAWFVCNPGLEPIR